MQRGATYRARAWLRVAVCAAASFWSAILAVAIRHPELGPAAILGALAFVAFFAAFAASWDRTQVVVTPEGFVFQTLFRRVPVRSEDILGVHVVTGAFGTLYAVLTRRGLFRFSSLFERHHELRDLLLERAGLVRRA